MQGLDLRQARSPGRQRPVLAEDGRPPRTRQQLLRIRCDHTLNGWTARQRKGSGYVGIGLCEDRVRRAGWRSPSWELVTGRGQRMQMVRDAAAVRANVSRGLEIYDEAAGSVRDGFSNAVLRTPGLHHPGRLGLFLPQAVLPAARIGAAKSGGAARLRQLPCDVRPQGDRQVRRRQREALGFEVLTGTCKQVDDASETRKRATVRGLLEQKVTLQATSRM